MEINEMLTEDIEKRSLEIEEEIKNGGDVETLAEEVEKLEARKAEIKAEAEQRKALLDSVAKAEVVEEIRKEEVRTIMSEKEIRNSKEYIDAYAEYIKTGDDKECRSILVTENASGTIAVPEFVYDIVKTAWERDGVMSLVRKTYLKGNLKVNFEISSDDAVIHTEGAAAIDPENLVFGIVDLSPIAIKKLFQLTKQAYSLRGEEFLRYVYEELTYKIAKKAADTLLGKIIAAGTASTTTCPGVPVITSSTVSLGLVAQAMAQLSGDAQNPVVIMNRQTWGAFKAAQAAGNFGYDPFEGLPVVYNNSITAFSAATTGVTYAIVGDLGYGAHANFPNGNDIEFTFDPYTKKAQNVIEILGEEYVGLGLVAPNAFVKIVH